MTVNLGKRTGAVSLAKGQTVSIAKTPRITLRTSWSTDTDYDLFALIRYRGGREETVAMFGTHARPNEHSAQTSDGAVRHNGDVGRGMQGRAVETIEIVLNDQIESVVPVVYSAQSNGTGSFRRYQVSMEIDNGQGTQVTVNAVNANDNDRIYSCVPGIVRNTPDGVEIEALELYSKPNSEDRPAFNRRGDVEMDKGPRNAYK